MSTSFMRIAAYGLIFQVMAGTISAAQRAVGNTKISLHVNVVANVVKLVANFLLIEGRFGFPRLEVDGAAVSMILAGVVSFVLAAWSVLKKGEFLSIRLRRDEWRLDMPMLKSIGRLTSGGVAEQVSLRVGFFIYARVVADLGTLEFAAHHIAMQLMNLSFTFADGIAKGITALVGQSLGRERPDLSIMYGKIGVRMALCVSAILSTVILITRNHFPLLFSSDPQVIQTAAGLALIMVYILPIQTSQIVMGGSLRGAGDTRFVAMTMFITVAIMRPGMGFLLTYTLGWGLTGAWIAIILDQGARLVMLFTRFSRGKWIRMRV